MNRIAEMTTLDAIMQGPDTAYLDRIIGVHNAAFSVSGNTAAVVL